MHHKLNTRRLGLILLSQEWRQKFLYFPYGDIPMSVLSHYYLLCLSWVPRCSHDICSVVKCLRVVWFPITTGDLLPGNILWKVPNLMRIGPIYSIEVTGDLWPDVTSSKVALEPPWGWDRCIHQISLVLRQRIELSPFQEGLLFVGSFISSLCLLLAPSFNIHKLKFVARLLIRWDFGRGLPLCMISKCGQFNLTWDSAGNVSLKIIFDILKVEGQAQYFTKTYDCFRQIRMGAFFFIHS